MLARTRLRSTHAIAVSLQHSGRISVSAVRLPRRSQTPTVNRRHSEDYDEQKEDEKFSSDEELPDFPDHCYITPLLVNSGPAPELRTQAAPHVFGLTYKHTKALTCSGPWENNKYTTRNKDVTVFCLEIQPGLGRRF
jgi:hypothetical protein